MSSKDYSSYCYTALNNTSLQSCCTPANNATYADVPWDQFFHAHPNRTGAPQNVSGPVVHTCTIPNWNYEGNFVNCSYDDASQGPTNNISRVWCFNTIDPPNGPVPQDPKSSPSPSAHSAGTSRLGKVGALLVCSFVAGSLLAL